MSKLALRKRVRFVFMAVFLLLGGVIVALSYLNLSNSRNVQAEVVTAINNQVLAVQASSNAYVVSGDSTIKGAIDDRKEIVDAYFEALEKGGSVRVNDVRVEVGAVAELTATRKLEELRSLWRGLKALSDTIFEYDVQSLTTESKKVEIATSDSTSVTETVTYQVPQRTYEIDEYAEELGSLIPDFMEKSQFLTWLLIDRGRETSRGNILMVIMLVIVVFVGLILAMLAITKFVHKPMEHILDTTKKLSEGDVEVKISDNRNDEFGTLADNLSAVVTNIREASDFVKSIGKGEFDTPYEVKNENDILGESLLRMREDLINIAEEDQKRNWSTTGLARFSEILRENNDDINAFGGKVVSELVQYVEANQGGLFIVNKNVEAGEETISLDLIASYAYDRDKYEKATLKVGEGLVGQAFLERKTIYMTNVPEDYVNITSGLGHATPKCVLIVPLQYNDNVQAILEIASFHPMEEYRVKFIEKLGETIASTLSAVQTAGTTKRLLEDSQAMTESIQSRDEEMRQNLEELQATQEEMARKQTEMNAINQRYQLLSHATEEGHWDMSGFEDGKITGESKVWCSASFFHLLGVERKMFSGMAEDWFELIYNADVANFKSQWDEWLRTAKETDQFKTEVRFKHPDDDFHWFRVRAKVVRDRNDKAERVAGSVNDIHRLRQLEAKAND